MSTTMRALRLHGARDARLETVARPSPGAGEVLLKITGAGICGTDAALHRAGPVIIPGRERARWPVVLGHEFAGRVVATGPEVTGLRTGDLVASGAGAACGGCAPCRRGTTNLCEEYWTAGVHRDGGLAEYTVVPAAVCEETGRYGVRGDTAALAQPMAIARHAVSRGRPRAGESALILGAGGIGTFATWAALAAGAGVTVCDRDAGRLAVVGGFGEVETVHHDGGTLVERLAPGGPWDVVYEMTGAPEPLAAATALVRPGGRIVVAGLQKEPPPVDVTRLAVQEIDLLGSMAHVRRVDLPRALELLGSRAAGLGRRRPARPAAGRGRGRAHVDGREGRGSVKTLVDPSLAEPRAFSG
ncbi:alcohol dehydrogenase catalytic domain-containing protein [Actinomadura madurae]|uniref:zinc-dependent alcohol dehydrogenase n=1 Tax=Actinomadura madurae TaxID=1993 RepID=UPI0020D23C96|nr:alcohol dehydrogenase catalytic domain-containing protein [Actinomadura madurae]MCP9953539.1 alcohol dehydrogenase catalytic domain-containing protein [Actinomadura madurae]